MCLALHCCTHGAALAVTLVRLCAWAAPTPKKLLEIRIGITVLIVSVSRPLPLLTA